MQEPKAREAVEAFCKSKNYKLETYRPLFAAGERGTQTIEVFLKGYIRIFNSWESALQAIQKGEM